MLSYLVEFEALNDLLEHKTNSQKATVFRVLYGKKKDRGRLAQKLKTIHEKYEYIFSVLDKAIGGRYGHFY